MIKCHLVYSQNYCLNVQETEAVIIGNCSFDAAPSVYTETFNRKQLSTDVDNDVLITITVTE